MFLLGDDFLGLRQFCELWRPKICRDEVVYCVVELWGGCCVVIRANFCRYVGRLWVGTRRSVVKPFSDVITFFWVWEFNPMIMRLRRLIIRFNNGARRLSMGAKINTNRVKFQVHFPYVVQNPVGT